MLSPVTPTNPGVQLFSKTSLGAKVCSGMFKLVANDNLTRAIVIRYNSLATGANNDSKIVPTGTVYSICCVLGDDLKRIGL